jgi:glycosyltransferase involved in cell wall biosynthesis
MKKVLIITYCYPPCNAISSHRPKSFADNFADHGLHPVVVTRHWAGDEKTWLDFQKPNLSPPRITKSDRSTAIELPYEGKLFERFNWIKSIGPLRTLLSLMLMISGKFQIHNYAIESFEGFLNEYLKSNPVDYIYATCDPFSIAQLGSRLSRKFGIPLVIDFRDLWNNKLLSTEYRPSLNERVIDYLYEWHISRWVNQATFVTAVTEPINEEVRRINPGMRTLTVTNGFETELFSSMAATQNDPNEKFTFSIIGTLFPDHDLSVLADGMDLFLEGKDLSKIQLNLIGTAGIPEIKEFLERRFPAECTRLTERIPREQALEIMNRSDVLFHAGWRNYRGIASGKVFEYMGARRNVLIAPGDKDIMEELVTSTGIGRVANSPEEFARAMNDWYDEWCRGGRLEWKGDMSKIMTYSRENQARILAEELLKIA